ncbi:acidobacterial duplicated orphan permease [Luteitalea pratensis]|uniref:Acidobacterial duplicated orphan permease n=1 Tax=Luteitalea pratensis TaxID=1855912 RepID=A0A143PTE2_LUTPR|nr:permease prefix domain 1-containing protein [Luteitalea pratensis]AMY11997.1 acidobacterial duplicated orphan permease [Luteitalea pratensis]
MIAGLRRWLSRLLNGVRPSRLEADLAREIDAHLALLEDEFGRRGLAPEEARRSARLALGGIDRTKEMHRDARAIRWLSDALSDIRYAARHVRHRPGFALIAIATLALGIGANTAMFTLVHRVLLDSLPVKAPDALVEVGCVDANKPDDFSCETSYPGFLMFRDGNDLLSGLFAFAPLPDLNVVHEDHAELATALLATGDMYDILGVAPAHGRLLTAADDAQGAPITVVLSHAYWHDASTATCASSVNRSDSTHRRGSSWVSRQPGSAASRWAGLLTSRWRWALAHRRLRAERVSPTAVIGGYE